MSSTLPITSIKLCFSHNKPIQHFLYPSIFAALLNTMEYFLVLLSDTSISDASRQQLAISLQRLSVSTLLSLPLVIT